MAEVSTESKCTGGPPSPGVRSPRMSGNSGKNTIDKPVGVPSTRSGAAVPIGENSSTSNTGESQLAPLTSTVFSAGPANANPLPGSATTGTGQPGNSSPRSPKHPRRNRIKLTEQQLESATREELAAKWREQDLYVECLEAQAAAQEGTENCGAGLRFRAP